MKLLLKIKNYLVQVAVLFVLYAITVMIIAPELSRTNPGSSLSTAGHNDKRFSVFFFLLFFPMLIRNMINIIVSPSFPLVQRYKSYARRATGAYCPYVSVIIPAWNEEVGIADTMRSVLKNGYARKELIVVNDGSTDRTEEKILEVITEYGKTERIFYIKKLNGGKASALNEGLKRAKGTIVVTIDADSFMRNDALEKLVRQFEDPGIMSVAGNVKVGNNGPLLGMVQMLEYLWGFYFKRADAVTNSIYIVGGAAAAYRKAIFKKLGGFDERTLTEDIEMSTRIQDAGGRIGFEPDAVVFTEAPSTVKGLVKQRLRWKKGRFETFLKYSHLFFSFRKSNPYLTFFVLPLALFMEILLFFEVFLLILLYSYVIASGNVAMLSISILVIAAVFSCLILIDEKSRKKYYLLLWAPVAWLVFYFIDFIEYQAQLRSIWSFVRGREIRWQKWQRTGVFGK